MEGGQTTHYLALGHKNLYEKTGTVATKHIFAGTQRIAEVKDSVVTYYHNDHLGSPRAVTNTSGTLIASTGTRPFGQPHSTNNPTNYLYTGKELDDTGLYYFAARYYDPSVGRFVTEDTWLGKPEEPWTQNRYVYVGSNPMRLVDPDGRKPSDALRSIIVHGDTISALAVKYNLPASLINSVVWNENKQRWNGHDLKDFGGLLLRGQASLGLCQVQMSTAAFLDTNPSAAGLVGIGGRAFNEMKDLALQNLSANEREALIARLRDPNSNLEYAAKYLALMRDVTGANPYTTSGAQQILSNYNRGPGSWGAPPSAYGRAYNEYTSFRGVMRYGLFELLPNFPLLQE